MTVSSYDGAYSLIPQCGFENVTSDDITPLLGPFEYSPGNVTTLLVHQLLNVTSTDQYLCPVNQIEGMLEKLSNGTYTNLTNEVITIANHQ